MAINRRFLYAGLFLVALGGVLVAVDLTTVDTTSIAGALRLWPLALIAIGAGIVLRRSRYALVAGIVGAMLPGLVLGGGLAVAPRHGLDCAAGGEPADTATQRGTFTRQALVEVFTTCGSVSIGSQPGADWQLTSARVAGRVPDVEFTGDRLRIQSGGGEDWEWLETGRDTWQLTLPTTDLERVAVTVEAGRASVALPDVSTGSVVLSGAGADMVADLSATRLAELDGSIDFGRIAVQLPASGTYSGTFRVDAGELRLCIPFFLGAHVDFAGSAREVRINGLKSDARSWENEGYATATNRADLDVKVNFGSVAINPIGGCK